MNSLVSTMWTCTKPEKSQARILLRLFVKEPFRIFFPLATLAGILGVSLWPLYFTGVTEFYPGLGHARIMAYGLFGGFILGFLGTAMPRMLAANPLRLLEVIPLLLMYLSMVLCFAAAKIKWGDSLFLILIAFFMAMMAPRVWRRKDLPPPGFVLVALSLVCVIAGGIIALLEHHRELNPNWITFQRLLSYQAFVLLPILGIGPFLLPRFLGMQSTHDFPESQVPSRDWLKKSFIALATGLAIILTFFIEAKGWIQTAYAARFLTVLSYMLVEIPFRKGPKNTNALGKGIRVAFAGIVLGFAAIALFPGYRVGLLHLTLVGGFAIITFTVATRVVFGHSGNMALLQRRNRWLLVAIGLMLFGMATRISGDFWPKIMASHYIYGAICWVAGVVLWAVYVLPKVVVPDSEK